MLLSEHRLTWQRCSKNSGGEIAPTAIAGLIEGALCSVNAFRPPSSRDADRKMADKPLMRLNFLCHPVNG